MKTSLFLVGAALLVIGTVAEAQNRGNGRGNGGAGNARNNGAQNGGAAFPLPEGIESVVSIDAYNILMAQVDRDGKRDLAPIIVRHIYSGGLARLFGGGSIPTEQFVTPGEFGGGNNRGNGGVRGGNQGGGLQGGGFQGGQTGGFQGGGFQGGGFQGGGIPGGVGTVGAFQMRPSAFRGRN